MAVVEVLPFLDGFQPIRSWFAIPLTTIWAWQVLLNLAWAGVGLAITRRLLPAGLPSLDRLCISAAVGVTGFTWGMYLLGALHLFAPIPAVVLVLVFIAIGVPSLGWWWRETAEASPEARSPRRQWLSTAALVFGVLGVTTAYLGVLTPDAINYDARWIHVGIAQDYAREGGLVAFPGDWQRAYPHLASLLYTWGFLVPGLNEPVTRWMLALHTEFSLFCWTLVGVGCAARWMAQAPRLRGSWAAYFLFPGIFVYDGNMGGAADHVLASFVPPLFLLSVRLPAFDAGVSANERVNQRVRDAGFVLWGIVAAGAVLTKYQAAYPIGPLAVVVAWGVLRRGPSLRDGIRRLVRVAGIVAVTLLAVTAPHFVKNLIFHRNPVYPLAQGFMTGSTPTVRDAPILVHYLLTDWNFKPPGDFWERVVHAAGLVFAFAFKPHYAFMGPLPTFGFLFALALPMLLLVGEARRLWIGALVSMTALFCWALTYLVDRNLQIILPLLAATTAAILIRAWRVGRLARIGVGALVALQLVWGGDLLFAGSDRTIGSISLIRSTMDGRARTRFSGTLPDYFGLNRLLPQDAVVLLHHWHPQLGINRKIFLDWAGFQGVVDYRLFKNARDYYDRLRALGVTHLVYLPGEQAGSSKQEDVILLTLALDYAQERTRIGVFEAFPLPTTPPPERPPLQVVAIGLSPYADGLYDITDLGTCRFLPPEHQHYPPPRVRPGSDGFAPLLPSADAVTTGGGVSLDPATTAALARDFQMATPYPGLTVYIRKLRN